MKPYSLHPFAVMTMAAFTILFSASGLLGADLIILTADSLTPLAGDNIIVTVNLQNASPFYLCGEFLRFDNTRLELTKQAAGSFSSLFVQDSRGLSAINASGEVRAGVVVLPIGQDNEGGNGTLGMFTFKTLTAGSTVVTTEVESPANPFGDLLISSNGNEWLPNIAGPLNITVIPEPGSTGIMMLLVVLGGTAILGQKR